jgi:hypothetical protein
MEEGGMKHKGMLIVALGLAFLIPSAQAQWSPAKRLTWTSGASEWPVLAADSLGHLHAFWTDNTTGHYEVYYRKSTNGGINWTAARRLTWASSLYSSVAVAVDTVDNIHLVWNDFPPGNGEIYYKKSTDGGATWTAKKRLTWTSGSSEYPAITVDSLGNIHVVWEDATPGDYEVYYKKSTDGGLTWTANQRVTWTQAASQHAKIASHWSGWLCLFWVENSPAGSEVYFKTGTSGGPAWSASKKVTWTSGSSSSPAISVDISGNLHVVWTDDNPGNVEVYYRKSTDVGATWTSYRRLTWTSGISYSPTIAVFSSGNPLVVWEESTPSMSELYWRGSWDGGDSWGASQRLTWNKGYSYGPYVTVDAIGNAHLVWWDDTPGNFEIFYKFGD